MRRGKALRTTIPDPKAPCPLDRVNRQFRAERPNQLWVSDFTYASTWQGWVYVAFVINTNTPSAPDRLGNPALKPELATGLDMAYEHYGPGGAMFSVGVFHRRLEGVVRQVLSLRDVSWARVPRWVSEPQNFANAHTSGLDCSQGQVHSDGCRTPRFSGAWRLSRSRARDRG